MSDFALLVVVLIAAMAFVCGAVVEAWLVVSPLRAKLYAQRKEIARLERAKYEHVLG